MSRNSASWVHVRMCYNIVEYKQGPECRNTTFHKSDEFFCLWAGGFSRRKVDSVLTFRLDLCFCVELKHVSCVCLHHCALNPAAVPRFSPSYLGFSLLVIENGSCCRADLNRFAIILRSQVTGCRTVVLAL